MRNGMAWLVCVLVFAVGGLATWSLTRGQYPNEPPSYPPATYDRNEGSAAPVAPPAVAVPAVGDPASLVPNVAGSREPAPADDFGLRKQIEYSMGSGAMWLFRMNTVKGRFLPGFLPSVNAVMEGDNFLSQAGAALTLARIARYSGDKGYAARATQAVLSLLDDTETLDDHGVTLRHMAPLLSSSANGLGAAGLLVAAVNELPAPQEDLLKKSEELCAWLRKQQRPDGSLTWTEGDEKTAGADPEGVNLYPGLALYGLMRSQAHRPAAWKTDVVRKAQVYYAPWWRGAPHHDVRPLADGGLRRGILADQGETLLRLRHRDERLAVRSARHESLDARHPLWLGGFMSWSDGKALATAPDVSSASYAESLAEACRVARESADLPRHKRYCAALESSLQFLATLQYTDANTQHFAPLYRQRLLVGGFHASHQDGDLRIDYTQHAVCAMVQYLAYVAR